MMGKRSDFDRLHKDAYQTIDPRAVEALLPHLTPGTKFAEPCCGDRLLIDRLEQAGHHCVLATDINMGVDAICLKGEDMVDADCIITNPPWSRPILHELIDHFTLIAPHVWLLFDADWAHTKQSAPYMEKCTDIVSVGRLIWIPGTKVQGKDNCAWYRFSMRRRFTLFHGRR